MKAKLDSLLQQLERFNSFPVASVLEFNAVNEVKVIMFQFFPSCFGAEELLHRLHHLRLVSILSQLLLGQALTGGTGWYHCFNSFPVASSRIRNDLTMPFNVRFGFNSFPVASRGCA